MASKVLVNIPGVPFSTMQVKKSHSGDLMASSLLLTAQDYACRVAHLEHSVRFLQEQHQLMLRGLHQEIESLKEHNRDLQFQLIFNKENGSSKQQSPVTSEEKKGEPKASEAAQLGREAAAARGEARAAEAHALQLQQMLDAQTERIRLLELREQECKTCGRGGGESPAALRSRLAEAERLVRRLRTDAERQRREVLAGGVTNLLFDGAAAQAAHLQCMKNSLSASLGMGAAELGFGSHGYRLQDYHFPPLPQHLWPDQHAQDFHVLGVRGRGRRPVTLPDLQTNHNGQMVQPTTVYANHHARPRGNGYDPQKSERKRPNHQNGSVNEPVRTQSVETQNETPTQPADQQSSQPSNSNGSRHRGRRNHRRGTSTDHT